MARSGRRLLSMLHRAWRSYQSITDSSARELALKEGMEVYAVIKASNVMIATD
jgi:ABC-type molybdate transport system ATPase subunit